MREEVVLLKEIRDLLKIRVNLLPVEKPLRSKDGRFIRHADGSTVTDNLLHLIWYPTLSTKMTWEEAQEECAKTGCRLPTRQELELLLDLTKCDPAIDKEIFPDTKTDDYYWTATPVAGNPGNAWGVNFNYGYVYSWYKGYNYYVRPCRSSQ